jgi:hypothetical protein
MKPQGNGACLDYSAWPKVDVAMLSGPRTAGGPRPSVPGRPGR